MYISILNQICRTFVVNVNHIHEYIYVLCLCKYDVNHGGNSEVMFCTITDWTSIIVCIDMYSTQWTGIQKEMYYNVCFT
jgi:hypothetical protein